MALIVETGEGLANADAYVTVAYADAYNTDFLGNAAWTGATSGAKEQAIRQATAFIDNKYRTRWKGTREFREQALAWPRSEVTDYDGYAIDSNIVPENVKKATVEAAVRFVAGTVLEPDASPESIGVASASERFDVFSQSTSYIGSRSTQPVFRKIDRMLYDYITGQSGASVERG